MRVVTPKDEICSRQCKLSNNCYGRLECSRNIEFTCCSSYSESYINNIEEIKTTKIEYKICNKELVGDHSDEYYLNLEKERSLKLNYTNDKVKKPKIKNKEKIILDELIEEDITMLISKITYLNSKELKSRFKDKKVKSKTRPKIRNIKGNRVANG